MQLLLFLFLDLSWYISSMPTTYDDLLLARKLAADHTRLMAESERVSTELAQLRSVLEASPELAELMSQVLDEYELLGKATQTPGQA